MSDKSQYVNYAEKVKQNAGRKKIAGRRLETRYISTTWLRRG
jgi:hypothetical protein